MRILHIFLLVVVAFAGSGEFVLSQSATQTPEECQTIEECRRHIKELRQQVSDLESQVQSLDKTPVTLIPPTPVPTPTPVVTDDWAFVPEYEQKLEDFVAINFCTDEGGQTALWQSTRDGINTPEYINNPNGWVSQPSLRGYFDIQAEYDELLVAHRIAGIEEPDWVPDHAPTLFEILPRMDDQYPGCSTGDHHW